MGNKPRTCVIADDHPSVLRSVRELVVEWGYTVLATARDGAEALRKIDELQPAMALVDLRLPSLSGIEVVRRTNHGDRTAVLIYTGYVEDALLREALDAGARAIVLKEAPLDDLRRALEIVGRGGTYVDPAFGAQLLGRGRESRLTGRERETLRLLAGGCSYQEIGVRLSISPETVRAHARTATRKLDARTRTEAVAEALRSGLIS